MSLNKLPIKVMYHCTYRRIADYPTQSFSVDVTDDLSYAAIEGIRRCVSGEAGLFAFEADSINMELIDVDKTKYWAGPGLHDYLRYGISLIADYPIIGSRLGELGVMEPWRAEIFVIYTNDIIRYVGICFSEESDISYDDEKATVNFVIYDTSLLLKKFIMGMYGYRNREFITAGTWDDSIWWGETITPFIERKYSFAYRYRYLLDFKRYRNEIVGSSYHTEENLANRDDARMTLDEGDYRYRFSSGGWHYVEYNKMLFKKRYLFSTHGLDDSPLEIEPDALSVYSRVFGTGSYHGMGANTTPLGYSRWLIDHPVGTNIYGNNGIIHEIIGQFNNWCPFFSFDVDFPEEAFDPPVIKAGGMLNASGVLEMAHIFYVTINRVNRIFIASFSSGRVAGESEKFRDYALHEIINGVDVVELSSGSFPDFEAVGEDMPRNRAKVQRGGHVYYWGSDCHPANVHDSLGMSEYGYFGAGHAGREETWVADDVAAGVFIRENGGVIGVWRRACRRFKCNPDWYQIRTLEQEMAGEGGTRMYYDGIRIMEWFNGRWEPFDSGGRVPAAAPSVAGEPRTYKCLIGQNVVQMAAWVPGVRGIRLYERAEYLVKGQILRGSGYDYYWGWVQGYDENVTNAPLGPWVKMRISEVWLGGNRFYFRGGVLDLIENTQSGYGDEWPFAINYFMYAKDRGYFRGDVTFDTLACEYEDATGAEILTDLAKLTNSIFKVAPISSARAAFHFVKRNYPVGALYIEEVWIVKIEEKFSYSVDRGDFSLSAGIINNEYYNDALAEFYKERFNPQLIRTYTIELVSMDIVDIEFELLWAVYLPGNKYRGIIQSIDIGDDTTIIEAVIFQSIGA